MPQAAAAAAVAATLGSQAIEVPVQVCGRRECVSIARASSRELAAAVEQRFEVRPPFLFADGDGQPLADDAALASYIADGDTVVVKLTEGVMHDFSRRVDQIRHLQWGFLSDQLAAAKQGDNKQKEDSSKWRQAFEREHDERVQVETHLQRKVDDLGELIRKERSARDHGLQATQTQLAELQTKQRKSTEDSSSTAAILRQGLTELAQSIGEEQRAREREGLAIGAEQEEIRRLLKEESGNREGVHAGWRNEALDLREQLAEVREALKLERRDRGTIVHEAKLEMNQVQHLLSQSVEEQHSEILSLASTIKDMVASFDEAKSESQRLRSEFEMHREAAATASPTKSSSVADLRQDQLAQRLEGFQVTLEQGLRKEAQERQKLVASTVEGLSQELKRRYEELARRCESLTHEDETEAKTREGEVSRIMNMVTEMSSERGQGNDKLAQKLAALEESSGQELIMRARGFRDLEQAIEDAREAMKTLIKAEIQGEQEQRRELEMSLSSKFDGKQHDMESRTMSMHRDLETKFAELRRASDQSNSQVKNMLAQMGNETSSQNVEVKGLMKQFGELSSVYAQVKEELVSMLEEMHSRLDREGSGHGDAISRLREDCKEAMQREVRSRIERDKALQEWIESEAAARNQDVKVLELGLGELREGLETHTHEVHLDGGGSVSPAAAATMVSMRRSAGSAVSESPTMRAGSRGGGAASARFGTGPEAYPDGSQQSQREPQAGGGRRVTLAG